MEDSVNTIHASHELSGNATKLEEYYAEWAARYDDDVRSEDYGGPRVVASLAAMVADSFLGKPPAEIKVLDAGCGTGLAGIELTKKGFTAIDGFDLSQEMVDIARRAEIYGKLEGGVDLNKDQPNPLGETYEMIVCCGVFTLGHVEPMALKRLAGYLADGGYLIVSTRNSYLDDTQYKKDSEAVEREGILHLVTMLPDARYIAEEGAHYWVYGKGPKTD
ncbi:class I SAM-dependent methyltransferase [Aurantimonas sp. VKM B-3413]|uniref:class I SAM-dependent DNA methyltransferase n=1 Tax=Aurantimonas sp. VKM B-3413 TaxID=2779401 RepID=UPI001E3DC4B4|nr:class I SAM-dependent methyltransferase [Aurantimonas sp. VKM B-3413]MCB8836996.1 class I SAM-dependent methyltransferase [Aurantimonas sp. VKM B-3413]